MDHLSDLLAAANSGDATGRARIKQLTQRVRDLPAGVDLGSLERAAGLQFDALLQQYDTDERFPLDETYKFDLLADTIEALRAVGQERVQAKAAADTRIGKIIDRVRPPQADAEPAYADDPGMAAAATGADPGRDAPAGTGDQPGPATGAPGAGASGTASAAADPAVSANPEGSEPAATPTTTPPAAGATDRPADPAAPATSATPPAADPAAGTPPTTPPGSPAPAAPAVTSGDTPAAVAPGAGASGVVDPAAPTPPMPPSAPELQLGMPDPTIDAPPASTPPPEAAPRLHPYATNPQDVTVTQTPAPTAGGDPGTPVTAAAVPPGAPGTGLARRPNTVAAIHRANGYRKAGDQQRQQTLAAAAAAGEPLRRYSIVASAEVPEYPYGQQLSVEQLGDAAAIRFAALPVGQPANGQIKANVARIQRQFAAAVQLTGNSSDIAVIDEVADERRLPGNSLLAATMQQLPATLTAATQAPSIIQDIWCTPSETDYTLCPPLATREGMIDLPTTGLPARGGIRYPVWTQFPEQAADASRDGWRGQVVVYPETDPLPGNGLDDPRYFRGPGPNNVPPPGAGYPKRCIEGPCVDWVEQRASLAYMCVTSDIIRDRTFPEGIARFLADALLHHEHFLNETYIGYISAHSDPVPAFDVQAGPGAIGSVSLAVTDRIGLLVAWFRERYKMALDATLEIVMPEWFREYLKRDLEKKNNRPYGAVSNAEIAALFAQYASRVQWVRDWQPLPDGTPLNGRVMPPDGWPNNVEIIAYPAGSWVLSQGNIIQLGVMYDYQLLLENRYSALFTEDAWMLTNRCNRTFRVTLTNLCANGALGPFRDACPPVSALALTPAGPTTLAPGATEQATATATLPSGGTEDVTVRATWGTSAPQVATVYQGLITAVAVGTATISVSYGGHRITKQVTVATTPPATAQDDEQSTKDSGGTTSRTSTGRRGDDQREPDGASGAAAGGATAAGGPADRAGATTGSSTGTGDDQAAATTGDGGTGGTGGDDSPQAGRKTGTTKK
ncbi:major capsid protein [Saccharothrix sp. HUAS TT1]|uniref:major capsid protein n=1 Tax=unclassified Saccharothrix TaxID=2593673 RepID=UPI00345B7C0F